MPVTEPVIEIKGDRVWAHGVYIGLVQRTGNLWQSKRKGSRTWRLARLRREAIAELR